VPLYEYRCLSCDHVFDVIQQYSDPPLTTCPECGKAVEKCVSSPAIQFKGSGFYITDYTNKGKQPDKGRKARPDTKADKPERAGTSETPAKKAETAKETKPKSGSGSGA